MMKNIISFCLSRYYLLFIRSSPFDEETVFIKKETGNLFSSMRMKKVKESLERYELIEAIYYTSDFQIKSFVEYQNVVFECK